MKLNKVRVGEKYHSKNGNILEITKIENRSIFYRGEQPFVSGVCDFESFREKVLPQAVDANESA